MNEQSPAASEQSPIGADSGESRVDDASTISLLTDGQVLELGDSLRKGSPFLSGTALPIELVGKELSYEASVWRESMLGGLLASWIMFVFAVIALKFFPTGASIISAGACLLALLALTTRKPRLALASTIANVLVFAWALSLGS